MGSGMEVEDRTEAPNKRQANSIKENKRPR